MEAGLLDAPVPTQPAGVAAALQAPRTLDQVRSTGAAVVREPSPMTPGDPFTIVVPEELAGDLHWPSVPAWREFHVERAWLRQSSTFMRDIVLRDPHRDEPLIETAACASAVGAHTLLKALELATVPTILEANAVETRALAMFWSPDGDTHNAGIRSEWGAVARACTAHINKMLGENQHEAVWRQADRSQDEMTKSQVIRDCAHDQAKQGWLSALPKAHLLEVLDDPLFTQDIASRTRIVTDWTVRKTAASSEDMVAGRDIMRHFNASHVRLGQLFPAAQSGLISMQDAATRLHNALPQGERGLLLNAASRAVAQESLLFARSHILRMMGVNALMAAVVHASLCWTVWSFGGNAGVVVRQSHFAVGLGALIGGVEGVVAITNEARRGEGFNLDAARQRSRDDVGDGTTAAASGTVLTVGSALFCGGVGAIFGSFKTGQAIGSVIGVGLEALMWLGTVVARLGRHDA